MIAASHSHVLLLGQLDLSELLAARHHVLVLDTHDRSRGSVEHPLVLHVLGAEVLLQSHEVLHVLLVDLSEGKAGGVLAVHERAEGGLALDNAVRDILAAAKGREERHHLNRLDIVSDDDKLGLAFFDELSDMVQTELEHDGLRANLGILVALLALLSLGLKTLLLHGLVLGLVAVEELEELSRLVLLEGLGEDVQRCRHLETHHEDSLLTLDPDILGPLDEPGEIASGLDVTTNAEVAGALLEQGVLRLGGLATLGGDDLGSFRGLLGHDVKINKCFVETR